ncbi:MAG: serine hydrolase [Bacteroidota bacterium]
MQASRRTFIKSAGLSGLSLGLISEIDFLKTSPTTNLPRGIAEAEGFDSQGIINFLDGIKASGLEWHSFMLVKNGKVISEAWWKPFESQNKHTMYSLSKSFTSTAIGLMLKERSVSIHTPVVQFFAESLPEKVSDNLNQMTIKHLLTMNTGHDTDTMPALRAKNDTQTWVKSFLEHPVIHQPGSHFLYNTGATYMLGAILHKVTGLTLEAYLQPRLFAPLNITGYDWEKSPQGLNTAGYGLRISTEDIAKLGQLYLQKGKWNGKQILPEGWTDEASKKQTSSQAGDNDWAQGYGYQFWRCKPGFYRGDGAYGQFCMVMPEYNTVLAMTCESFNLQKTMDVAYENLLPAISLKKLPNNVELQTKTTSEIAKLSLATPKGNTSSPLMSKYSDKVFDVSENKYGLTAIGFGLFADAGVLRVNYGNGVEKIGFGWEKWKVNPNKRKNPFPMVNSNTTVLSRIASTATWLNDNTLQINFKFVDQVHGDKLTCVFNDNNVSITLINSVSENTKNNPDKREKIIGNMIS